MAEFRDAWADRDSAVVTVERQFTQVPKMSKRRALGGGERDMVSYLIGFAVVDDSGVMCWRGGKFILANGGGGSGSGGYVCTPPEGFPGNTWFSGYVRCENGLDLSGVTEIIQNVVFVIPYPYHDTLTIMRCALPMWQSRGEDVIALISPVLAHQPLPSQHRPPGRLPSPASQAFYTKEHKST